MTRNWKFGEVADGTDVRAFELTSESGCRAVILNYGAILQSFHLPDGRNVALGFKDWDEYETDESYIGRIIGPNANRILGSKFQIDGDEIRLTANEGPNHLHGGFNGFHTQLWTTQPTDTGLTLKLNSPDGFHEFPGAMDVTLNMSLKRNSLKLDMRASSDKATPMNLTWHPYWNLSGNRIDGHNLLVDSETHSRPETRESFPVKNTRFDFRSPLPLGSVELDANYRSVKQAILTSGDTQMRVTSSLPDMQVYSGDALPTPRSGIALEPQYRPNDMNFDQDSLLRPGQIYQHWIEYSFEMS